MITPAQIQSRLDRLRAALEALPAQQDSDQGAQPEPSTSTLDFIITDSLNVGYLCGMTGLTDSEDPHVALVTPDAALLFTDSRYSETARIQAAHAGDLWEVIEFTPGEPVTAQVASHLAQRHLTAVALEDTVSYRRYNEWGRRLGEHHIAVQASSGVVEGLRRHKDAGEVEAIAAAQAITDAAFSQMLTFMQPGMTELDIASELEYRMRKLGATGLAFPSIIASGPNGARPHAVPSTRVVEPGDFVVMDFGAARDGYCSDMTRTVAFGDPGAEARQVYAIVLAAQLAGLQAARPGATGSEVDAAAREVITQAGYGSQFGHGLSHGLGLLVHETPHCAPRSTDVLAPGDVISMEPGIYLSGRFGVRTEDLITITQDGARNFTASPKKLTELTIL